MLETKKINIPVTWLRGDAEKYFVLSVNDDNYHPYFDYGDILICCNDISEFWTNGIMVYEINGKLELRRLIIEENGTEILEGITPFIPPHINTGFKQLGYLYMRISNYRQGDNIQ